MEAIPDAIPGGSWGELFDDHQCCSTVIALMQVAVEGAGKGLGIVGDERHLCRNGFCRNLGMGEDEHVVGRDQTIRQSSLEFAIRLPGPHFQSSLGRVMATELTGTAKGSRWRSLRILRANARRLGDLFGGNDAWPQDSRTLTGDIHHRALDAHRAGPSIHNERYPFPESGDDVFRGRGGELVRRVGAGGSQRESTFPDHGLKKSVGGPSEANGRATRGDDIRNSRRFGDNQSQRSRPELSGQFFSQCRPI